MAFWSGLEGQLTMGLGGEVLGAGQLSPKSHRKCYKNTGKVSISDARVINSLKSSISYKKAYAIIYIGVNNSPNMLVTCH